MVGSACKCVCSNIQLYVYVIVMHASNFKNPIVCMYV